MNIAFVSQPFDRLNPGLQNSIGMWTYEVGRRLAGKSKVTVYVGGIPGHEQLRGGKGMEYRSMSLEPDQRLVRLLERKGWTLGKNRPAFSSPFYYLFYALRVAADIAIHDFDIIHVYNFTQFISIIRSINPRPNVVLNMRCGWLSQLDRQIVEPRLSGVDMIMGVSEHVTRGISDRFPGLAPICHTVNNGAHAVQTSRREVGQDVLFVGRVSPEKGVHVLLEAFAYLADRFPGTKLKVVGRKRQLPMGMLVGISDEPGVSGLSRFYTGGSLDEYQKYLEGRTTELGLEDRVTFTGFLPHSDVLDLYTRSYLLVNPSLSESFGRSLIEAMMAGIPVVASDAGGMGEIVRDGESGFLVEAGDSKGLASAMALLLGDRELGKRMGEAGRRVAKESYGWDLIAAKVYELYRNL